MKKSTIGILGMGEVGSAVSAVFSKRFRVLKKDIKLNEINKSKLDVLHICIPYSKKFVEEVIKTTKISSPKLVIIHSTVKPKTTAIIYAKTKIPIAHSPVMGVHPHLERDLKKFVKFIGPVNKISKKLAVSHFNKVGIKTKCLNSSEETEIGKLLDTTYYGISIAFNKYAAEICAKEKLNFDNVYTAFNKVYNEGYRLTKPNVIRPILKYQKGPIGGHCVIPNAEVLHNFRPSGLTKLLIQFNKKLQKL